MNWYKKSEDVGDWISEQYHHAAYEVLSEFVRNPRGKQPWAVVSAARLKKIWEDFATYGIVHDEKGLEEIAEQIARNVFRLQVNTELAGHTGLDPKEVYEDTGIKYTKRRDELFGDYILVDGQWRLSDFGLDPLIDDAIKLKQASSSKEKLLIIDNMLNIVHQRSNLPAMFVEGGGTTLDDLYENNLEKIFMDKERIKEIIPPQETDPKQIQLNLAHMSNWYKTSKEKIFNKEEMVLFLNHLRIVNEVDDKFIKVNRDSIVNSINKKDEHDNYKELLNMLNAKFNSRFNYVLKDDDWFWLEKII